MATIVIVEDDELVREVVATALENAAHTVIAVEDGTDAIDCLWESDPDLVILDCALPGRGGLPILQELRASPKFQAIPVLILTARRSDWHAKLAMDTGASDYLRKPFKVRDLLNRVSTLLRKAVAAQNCAIRDDVDAEPLIDEAYIGTLRSSLGQKDTNILLGMMASSVDRSVDALAQLIDRAEHAQASEEAHALSGAAKTIGARRLAALCRSIEHDHSYAGDLSARLFEAGAATRKAIDKLLSESSAVLRGNSIP